MNNDGEIRIGTKIDTSGFEKGAKELKKEASNVDKEVTAVLSKNTQASRGFGNALGVVANKAVKLGSALFNVVAIGGLLGGLAIGGFILGKALDKANGKSEQLKANLSYIGFVASKIFENLLQPAIDKTAGAINGLVGALYKAVVYIGYIFSAWSGKDLFAGTSVQDYAKSMEDANKSAKSTAKATKQMKKDLMGFDEVNKLSENTTSSTGGGTGTSGITMPTLPNLGDVPIPGWVDWIARNKDVILKVTGALLAILTFSKVVSWLAPLGQFFGLFTGGGLTSSLGKSLGTLGKIGAVVGSIALMGYSVYTWAKGNVDQQEQLNNRAEKGYEIAKKDAKTVKKISDTEAVILDKRKTSKEVLEKSHGWGAAITMTASQLAEQVKSSVKQQDEYLKVQIEAYKQGKLNKEEQEKLKNILIDQVDYLGDIKHDFREHGTDYKIINEYAGKYRDILVDMGEKQYQFSNEVDRTKYMFGQVADKLGQIGKKQEEATDQTSIWAKGITSVKDEMKKIQLLEFAKKKLNIEIETDTKAASQTLENLVKGFARIMIAPLNAMGMTAVANNIKKTIHNMTGIKLAQGGIINNPGRGVALGSNIIGGEAGREAVIPLDDTTMNKLGEAIARHMNVNLTNVTEMNGRTISRELKKISNENNFSYNG